MIIGVVWSALNGFAPCHIGTFPQPHAIPVWPAIRIQVVSMSPVAAICGTDDGTTDETRLQIDYVARTHGAAVALRAEGRVALMSVYPPAQRETGFETFDAETKTHRASDDYIFHQSSLATS